MLLNQNFAYTAAGHLSSSAVALGRSSHCTRSIGAGEFTFQPIGERHNIGGQDSEVIAKAG